MSIPTYPGDGFMFRTLSPEEVAEFTAYAQANDPPAGKDWSLYHPVCRSAWIARGLTPSASADSLRQQTT